MSAAEDKKQFQKRVRLNLKERSIQSGRSSNENQSHRKIVNETVAECVRRNSAVSNASSGSKKNSILLDSLKDEMLIKKHVSLLSAFKKWNHFHNFSNFQCSNTVEIEIVSLELIPHSKLLTESDSKFLYVEYAFLGYQGHLLESNSLKMPRSNEPVYFRFSQKFKINPTENEKQFKMLKSMLLPKSKDQIKFLVVSEPNNEDKDDGECEEVGWVKDLQSASNESFQKCFLLVSLSSSFVMSSQTQRLIPNYWQRKCTPRYIHTTWLHYWKSK